MSFIIFRENNSIIAKAYSNRYDGVINACFLKNSKIRYSTYTSKIPFESEDLLIETYEEARKIVLRAQVNENGK